MEEILVITACLYQKGCPETASHLYNQRPQLQEFVMKTEARAKEVAGPLVTSYVAPVFVFAAGGTGTLNLYRNVSLKYNRSTFEMIFKKEF